MIDKLSAMLAGDATDGYATGVPYTFGYYRELAPALLRVALLAGGIVQATEARRFRYCELGCGRGLTSNILAATHPEAEFLAVDFDPAHIAEARALAQAAGLANLQFSEASFEAFAAEDGPAFDFMVLHGVYSWVSPANRVILMRLIERRLRPGGIAYVSYNAQPGWSHLEPLRRLLWELVAHGEGAMLERVRAALATCCQMRDAGAAYFARNPEAGRELDLMQARGPGYIVHEHLNRYWQPQYHADMVSVLAGAGCRFGASADLTDHLDALDLGAADIRRLRAITDPVHARTLKDFMVDRRFRRDLFVKGPQAADRTLTEAQSWAAWQDQHLALAQPRSLLKLAVPARQGVVHLDPAIHVPLLDALADGPCSVAQLRAGDARVAALSPATLIESLVMLLGSGHVEPCPQRDEQAQDVVDAAHGAAQRLNQALLARVRDSSEITHLAAPRIGGAVQVDRSSQRFLLAEAEVKARPGGGADAVDLVARHLGAQGARLTHGGKVLQDPAAIRAELQRREVNFRSVIRPHLQRLGVVGAAPQRDDT